MESDNEGAMLKKIPLAVVLTVIIQSCGIVWWASARDRSDFFQDQRIGKLETEVVRAREGEGQILERLARIEERGYAQSGVLDRIEKRIMEVRR